MKNARTILAASTASLLAVTVASGAVADKLKGQNPGDSIRCTYQVSSGGNSATFDVTRTVGADGTVTFPKAGGTLNWVYYMNNTTGAMLSALDPSGEANLWDSIHIGDSFALFGGSTGAFATIIATDLYIQNPALTVGTPIGFVGGQSSQLPGVTLLFQGAPYSGIVPVSGFNEVVDVVPAPGAAALLGLGAMLVTARRRRSI